MASRADNEYVPDSVSPPGATLKELLAERDLSPADLARQVDCPLQVIDGVITAHAAMTPEIAHQLERVLGVPARFWLRREQDYRAALARAQARAHPIALDGGTG